MSTDASTTKLLREAWITGALEHLGHRILYPREVYDRLPHDSLRNLVEIVIARGCRIGRCISIQFLGRLDQPEQVLVEPIFNAEKSRRHIHEESLVDLIGRIDNGLQFVAFGLNNFAELSQAEHAHRVTDFLQQFDLGEQLFDVLHAGPNVDVQNILDTGEIVANCLRNRLHQSRTRRCETFPNGLYLVIAQVIGSNGLIEGAGE